MNPNVSLNFGVRYELQFPFVAKNNSYSIGDIDDVYGVSGVGNLFQPGVLDWTCSTVPSAGRRR